MGIKHIIIGCYFPEEIENAIVTRYVKKRTFSVSNLVYERKLVCGLEKLGENYLYISAPVIGEWPKSLNTIKPKFNNLDKCIFAEYLTFYYIKHISKTIAIKKTFKKFFKKNSNSFDENVNIWIMETHSPYFKGARYIRSILKKEGIDAKYCCFCPDLQENIIDIEHKSFIYNLIKKIDTKQNIDFFSQAHSYVLFSKSMVTKFGITKPHIILPGIQNVDSDDLILKTKEKNKFIILFSGKLQIKNGIKLIIDAFKYIDNENVELWICGSGNEEKTVIDATILDNRIKYFGLVSHKTIIEYQQISSIVLSLRTPEWEGINYSFPSKFFEALSSKKPVITFKLPTYDREVDDFVFYSKVNSLDLAKTILKVLEHTKNGFDPSKQINYLNKFSPKNSVIKILNMINSIND